MDREPDICKRHNAVVIEDAAESLGTLYKGRHTGTFGDYGVYSFNGNKNITIPGGGILVSRHSKRNEKARFWMTRAAIAIWPATTNTARSAKKE